MPTVTINRKVFENLVGIIHGPFKWDCGFALDTTLEIQHLVAEQLRASGYSGNWSGNKSGHLGSDDFLCITLCCRIS